jgi:hypothetical protein
VRTSPGVIQFTRILLRAFFRAHLRECDPGALAHRIGSDPKTWGIASFGGYVYDRARAFIEERHKVERTNGVFRLTFTTKSRLALSVFAMGPCADAVAASLTRISTPTQGRDCFVLRARPGS